MFALALLMSLASTPDVDKPQADVDKPQADVDKPRWAREGWGFGGVPALGYDPDAGFLFGAIGNIYRYDGVTAPYRETVQFQLLMTHKLVQDHSLSLDALRFLDLPLRVNARVGFAETFTQNYCGLGPSVTCDIADAERDADLLDLAGEQREAHLRRYFVFPYISPNVALNLRWRVNAIKPVKDDFKIEVLGGWRGALYVPGIPFDDDADGRLDLFPYAGSRYAADFPGGEPGFASVLQAGVIIDRRDNEPSPRHGWLAETSLRGAHPVIGSTWSWAGANLTLRGYTPLLPRSIDPQRRLVVAARIIADGVLGDPPVAEMTRIGGSVDVATYGGTDLGRGIRGQRFLGRLKLLEQQELRWHFYDFEALGQHFGLITNAFLDAGLIGLSVDEPGALRLPIGFGAALGISWNEAFILRVDVAASSVEGFSPYPYITLGQSF
jgi:hypothetical protein